MQTLENKINIFLNKPILSLAIIAAISLILRLIYFPFEIPVVLDGLSYFWYASDISILKGFPSDYDIGNNGWPIFLAVVFSFFNFDNFIDYMTLQKITSSVISILTIIPVYLICRRFFDKSYSVIGAALFAFEPRIIQNSLFGITDPAYILLSAISFGLFFSKQNKFFYLSFVVAGFAAFVRSEGIFIFVAFTVVFFIIHKVKSKSIIKYFFALGLYLSTILPMIFWRIQNTESDLISGRVLTEANNVMVQYSPDQGGGGLVDYTIYAISNFIQLGGWSLIPVFIFFIPFGIYFLFKQKNLEFIHILILIIILLIPVFFAFSVASDIRYIFYIFPLFSLISLLAIKKIKNIIKNQNIFLVLIICGVLLSSITYLEIKLTDNQYQKEGFDIAKKVIQKTQGINDYYPQSAFLDPASIPDEWPILKSSFNSKIHIFNTESYSSLKQFVEDNKNKGLTHIVVDDYEKRQKFLKEVYFHDKNYPYLKKIFDSKHEGFSKYHLKIYEIDYLLFK